MVNERKTKGRTGICQVFSVNARMAFNGLALPIQARQARALPLRVVYEVRQTDTESSVDMCLDSRWHATTTWQTQMKSLQGFTCHDLCACPAGPAAHGLGTYKISQ